MAHSNLNAAAAEALAVAIRKRVRGEVRFNFPGWTPGAIGATRGRPVPVGVVIPRDVSDVVETVAACRRHDTPVIPRGGGTGVEAQRRGSQVIIDMSKYLRGVLAIDPERRRAVVEPGCALDSLCWQAEKHHLSFCLAPSVHDHRTLGAVLGRDACSPDLVMAGARAADHIHRLDILTYDGLRMTVGPTSEPELETLIREGGRRGEIYAGLKALRDKYADAIRARFPRVPRRVSGYAIDQLLPENGFNVARALVGTEGTCVIVLHAELHLVPSPPERTLLLLGYSDIYKAADQNAELMEFGPLGLEAIDDQFVQSVKAARIHPREWELLPEGKGWLILEFGGETREESEGKARQLMGKLRGKPGAPTMKLLSGPREKALLWNVRAADLAAAARVPGSRTALPGWGDAAVHPCDVGPYLKDYRALLDKYGYRCALYGHLGQGCIHCRVDFSNREGSQHWQAFLDEATDLIVRYNGSLSVQWGDGMARSDLLPKLYGDRLVQAFREFKAIWDPWNRMNPGRVTDQFSCAEPPSLKRAM